MRDAENGRVGFWEIVFHGICLGGGLCFMALMAMAAYAEWLRPDPEQAAVFMEMEDDDGCMKREQNGPWIPCNSPFPTPDPRRHAGRVDRETGAVWL